jgi:hypothetical protein
MTGLPVSPTSKTYEGAAFGFMQKETGKEYKLTCAYTGGELGEVLGDLFDSGTAHCATKLIDLLLLIEKRVGSPPRSLHKYRASIEQSLAEAGKLERRSHRRREEAHRARKSQRQAVLEGRAHKLDTRGQLLREKVSSLQIADCFDTLRSANPYRAILIRGDAGFGSIDKIMLLLDLGYFLLKGYSPHTARNLAEGIAENEWIPFNGTTSVAELGAIRLPGCPFPLPKVLHFIVEPAKKRRKMEKEENLQRKLV